MWPWSWGGRGPETLRASTARVLAKRSIDSKTSTSKVSNAGAGDNVKTIEKENCEVRSVDSVPCHTSISNAKIAKGYVTPIRGRINLFGSMNNTLSNHALDKIKRRFDFVPTNIGRRLDFSDGSDELQL